MCLDNTALSVCGKPLEQIAGGVGHETRIPWCPQVNRTIYQFAAHFQLAPSNISTKVFQGSDGNVLSVFSYLCRLLKCDYPGHPQFNNAVHPKLVAHVNALLRNLHKRHVIVMYNLEGGSKKAVYWPEYTRRWAEPAWDCGLYGETVPEDIRRALARVSIGAEVPAVVLAAREGAARLGISPAPAPVSTTARPQAEQPVEAHGGPGEAPGMEMDIDMEDDTMTFATRSSTFWTASDDEDVLVSEGDLSDGESLGGYDLWDHLDSKSPWLARPSSFTGRQQQQQQQDGRHIQVQVLDPGMPIPRSASEYHRPRMEQIPAGRRGPGPEAAYLGPDMQPAPPPVVTAAPLHLWPMDPELHDGQHLAPGMTPPPQPPYPDLRSFSIPDSGTAAGQFTQPNTSSSNNNKGASKKARRRKAQRDAMAALKKEVFDLLQRQRQEQQGQSQQRQPHDEVWPAHQGVEPGGRRGGGGGGGGQGSHAAQAHHNYNLSNLYHHDHHQQSGLYQSHPMVSVSNHRGLGDRRARLEEQLMSIQQEERQREQQKTIRDTIKMMEVRRRERRLRLMKQPEQWSPQAGPQAGPRVSSYPPAAAGFGPSPPMSPLDM